MKNYEDIERAWNFLAFIKKKSLHLRRNKVNITTRSKEKRKMLIRKEEIRLNFVIKFLEKYQIMAILSKLLVSFEQKYFERGSRSISQLTRTAAYYLMHRERYTDTASSNY